MFAPTVRHRCWKVGVEPVKWMPARSGWLSATCGDVEPVAGQHVDDAGRHARPPRAAPSSGARRAAGSATASRCTVLPISAGAVGRLPAIAVKLNGVIA